MGFLIYGANGYTGDLVAREAARRGLSPILAGRREDKVRPLAESLGFAWRAFGLDDPRPIRDGLAGVGAVLHCAGPFSRTSQPMADACLATGVHYLDITGEAVVFEALAARDAEAQRARVMLLPGVGFDVVPSDCLAAHLKRRLPAATRLTLAFLSTGRTSHGTATTVVENLGKGGLVRVAGTLTRVPLAWKWRDIDFGRGPRPTMTIPWGDVATAYHSTGIPDIEVYIATSPLVRRALRLVDPVRGLLATGPVQAFLKGRVDARTAGPTDAEREGSLTVSWGEVEDAAGQIARARQSGPDGYTTTVLAALAIVARVEAGEAPPGFMTPAKAYGPDLVLELPGVTRTDL